MITTFSPIPTGAIPAARALRSASRLCPGGRLGVLVKEGASAAAVVVPSSPKPLLILPLVDHFFAGQLEPAHTALSGWLKEQLR